MRTWVRVRVMGLGQRSQAQRSVMALLKVHVRGACAGTRTWVAHNTLDRLRVVVRTADGADGETHLAHNVLRTTWKWQVLLTTVAAAHTRTAKVILVLVTAIVAALLRLVLLLLQGLVHRWTRRRARRDADAMLHLCLLLQRLELVECKVLQQRRARLVCEEDAEHLVSSIRQELLRVARVGDGLALLRVAASNQ